MHHESAMKTHYDRIARVQKCRIIDKKKDDPGSTL